MAEHAAVHELEWDVSPWPFVISVGIIFLVPLAFAFKFVYHQPMLAVLSLGIGVPLIIAGIAGWVSEAIGGGHGPSGLSVPAMGWFILAEAMIFVSFFVSYWYMRLGAPTWPPEGTVELPVVMPLIMTFILVSSSVTIHFAEEKLEHGDRAGFLQWLLITMILGVSFLSMSVYEWTHLFHEGFVFSTNIYSTSFFTITGFHGAHVLIGLGIFITILVPALLGKTNLVFLKAGSLYWHFVDIIWFFVVSQVYYW
ncbi:MAG TPA: heme-copper oxidase subunit III [Thiotrichaceae bacterium]|nr:heme-copper oxidase subunit III [Thiotrichaceae bacterium]